MRRLLLWTFHALAAASLLLCMATAALWVRSYWVYDRFLARRQEDSEWGREYGFPHAQFSASSFRGCFAGMLEWYENIEGRPVAQWTFKLTHSSDTLSDDSELNNELRFTPASGSGFRLNECAWHIHDWMLVSAFALFPAIATFLQVRAICRRRRRARLGCCPACGYDLRATPGRCPECGRGGSAIG